MPSDLLIAGGGPAAIEAALVLRRLAGERVTTTVLTPERAFTYRPLSVLGPFAAGHATEYPLDRIARDAGFTLRDGRLARVDVEGHAVETTEGERVPYDMLLLATGAVPEAPFAHGVDFGGRPDDDERVHGLVQDVEQGYAHRIAFVVPPGTSWPLPIYELALMLAQRAYETGAEVELHMVTPEQAPLAVFGSQAADEVRKRLDRAGIELRTGVTAEPLGKTRLRLAPGDDVLDVERIVTLAVLRGPRIPGLPADADGFVVTDRHGRVLGADDVFAAGDATAFPIKQGGLATQQADAAAETIAAHAGAPVEPAPFSPVLRGVLLTENWSRFLRRDASGASGDDAGVAGHALWWPPTKIAGRELASYLEGLDEELGRTQSGLHVNVPVEHEDVQPVEVLGFGRTP